MLNYKSRIYLTRFSLIFLSTSFASLFTGEIPCALGSDQDTVTLIKEVKGLKDAIRESYAATNKTLINIELLRQQQNYLLELDQRFNNLQMQITTNTNEKNNIDFDLNKFAQKYRNASPSEDDQITIDTLNKQRSECETKDISLNLLSDNLQKDITKEKAKLDEIYSKIIPKQKEN